MAAKTKTLNGAELIYRERNRQLRVEGWTAEHDDDHCHGELATAAACYAKVESDNSVRAPWNPPREWPWDREWWKPKSGGHANDPKRIADLVRAGALIAAEIDRLQRYHNP
jgi:hypothetical protein